MARFTGTNLLKHVSGIIGKQLVIKHRQGTAYIAAAPVREKPFTKNERTNQKSFGEIAKKASALYRHRDYNHIYLEAAASARRTPYQVAQSDIRNPPQVVSIHTQAYTGNAGEIFLIYAKDDVMVTKVLVQLLDSNGKQIEKGNAVQGDDIFVWHYTTSAKNDHVSGSKIIVQAFDIPGNKTVKEADL